MSTGAPFPSTHWSILKPGSGETEDRRRAGWRALAELYWKPVYAHFRLKWGRSREEAEDLTQDFFAWVLEGPFLDRARPGCGRFRAFVRAHLDHFVQNHLRAERRLKRGGGLSALPFDEAERRLAELRTVPPEEVLDRQWRSVVLDEAVRLLRDRVEPDDFEVFRRYDLAPPGERPTYEQLASDLGLRSSDIDNRLARARKRLYELVREVVAASVEGPDALEDELDSFFRR